MKRIVPVNTPLFEGNEKKYLVDCIDTGWISSEGLYVTKFESSMAKYVERKFGFAVCNGTAALETAVLALDLEKGSEIILPDFTIISCAQAIVKAGLIPVPVDCDLFEWNIDTSKIEEKITSRTRAIMVAHIYGMPCNMKEIRKIADKYGLYVIEDAAEAHGLLFDGKKCGSFGDVSTFSFYPNKNITCGEGGMVLTDNEIIAARIKKIRNLFFDEERRYIHSELGSNFRMTNMQAAIGLAQLERIECTVKRKRCIGQYYYNNLKNIEGILLQRVSNEHSENIFWVFGIVLERNDFSADELMKELGNRGIGTRHFFYPMHKQPALKKMNLFCDLKDEDFKNANFISERGLYIPSGVGITRMEQEYVIEQIVRILE